MSGSTPIFQQLQEIINNIKFHQEQIEELKSKYTLLHSSLTLENVLNINPVVIQQEQTEVIEPEPEPVVEEEPIEEIVEHVLPEELRKFDVEDFYSIIPNRRTTIGSRQQWHNEYVLQVLAKCEEKYAGNTAYEQLRERALEFNRNIKKEIKKLEKQDRHTKPLAIRHQEAIDLWHQSEARDVHKLIVGLYTFIPALRSDYRLGDKRGDKIVLPARLKQHRDNPLNIVFQDGTWQIGEERNTETGETIIDIPEELKGFSDDTWNKVMKTGNEPKTANAFRKILYDATKAIFKKNETIGIYNLRKMWVRSVIDNGNNFEERMDLAEIMAHSPQMSREIYERLDNSDNWSTDSEV